MIIRRRSATFRYRAGRIVHIIDAIELPGGSVLEPSVFAEDVKEFRTLKRAKKYQAGLTGTSFIQFGVLVWSSADEIQDRMYELQTGGIDLE